MSINKFLKLTSRCIPMPAENIDTDQIIPARYLKLTQKEGYGKYLFYDQRYNNNEEINYECVLNNSDYKGEILIAGYNFGCGSSREHAPWAIIDYGFKVVISSFFADIFRNNALNNGLLVIQLSKEFHSSLINETCENPELLIEIDLKEQSVKIKGTNKKEIFEINQYKKECLLNGYDDVDYLLSCKNIIEEFEQKTNK